MVNFVLISSTPIFNVITENPNVTNFVLKTKNFIKKKTVNCWNMKMSFVCDSLGIPFPAYKDPKVQAKRNFLDTHRQYRGGPGGLSGNGWFNLQASRAVNQSLGRVIRHSKDFGVMILLDERYFLGRKYYSIIRFLFFVQTVYNNLWLFILLTIIRNFHCFQFFKKLVQK